MNDATLIGTGIGIVVSVVGINALMLKMVVTAIKEHCLFQKDSCSRRICEVEEDNASQWSALHSHGHKGLDNNGNKVTR